MAQHPILNAIKSSSEYIDSPISVLIYSEPGHGKTTWAATAPEPLIIDVDSGSLSVALNNVPILRDKYSYENFVELITALKQNPTMYKTIVIDTVSELQKRWTDKIVQASFARNSSRHQFIPTQQDYNETTIMIRRVVLDLLSIGRNVILVAHSVEKQDGADGPTFIRPNMTPALAGALFGLVDIMCFMKYDNRKKERTYYFEPTFTILAKHRYGTFLPASATNVTFNQLIKAKKQFHNELNKETENTNGNS